MMLLQLFSAIIMRQLSNRIVTQLKLVCIIQQRCTWLAHHRRPMINSKYFSSKYLTTQLFSIQVWVTYKKFRLGYSSRRGILECYLQTLYNRIELHLNAWKKNKNNFVIQHESCNYYCLIFLFYLLHTSVLLLELNIYL